MSGKKSVDFGLTVNGGIPAPILEFTEGDDAEIIVKNRIPDQEASIHWHGILLPSDMDGVPYVSNAPIKSGEDFTFRFKIRQNGTYWYHSHTMTQEQEGVFGPIVIHPKKESIRYDKDVVVLLSDWADESGEDIIKNLRKDGDYYLYKKGTMRSWLGAIQAKKLGSFLKNEWTRMGGMDFSDVGYDAFLMNGKKDFQLLNAHRGEKIRIRIINAAASSYFYVSLGQSPMKVISSDGQDIEPADAKELFIGMAETYDVLFELPENRNYELKATSQDGLGFASGWIGMGEKISAPSRPFPDMYMAMNHSAHKEHRADSDSSKLNNVEHTDHLAHRPSSAPQTQHGCKAEEYWDEPMEMCMPSNDLNQVNTENIIEILTVDNIKAKESTAFLENAKNYDLKLVLGGDMRRYIWFINGKAAFEDRILRINEGDIIRFTFENTTMMHHPMHLHGHFFRVVNKNGDRSPLKHTVDVPPHATRTIEFLANEPGYWMLHCHNLFHMNSGMARVVEYSNFKPSPEIEHLQHQDHHLHDPWYFYGNTEVATNHAQANLRFSQTWNEIEARFETRNTSGKNLSYNEPWEVESDLLYHRWFNQYFHLIGGGLLFDRKISAAIGASYILPMLIKSRVLVDHRGKFRFDVEKRFQWSKNIFTDVDLTWRPNQADMISHDFEFEVSLMYGSSWSWAVGLMLTDRNIGAGIQVKF